MEKDENGKVRLDRDLEGSSNVAEEFVLSLSYAIRNHQRIVDREEIDRLAFHKSNSLRMRV